MRFANFFALAAIIGTLPNNIQNGQTADAVPLMADLNWIVNQVNANAAPLSNTPQLNAENTFTDLQSGVAATSGSNFPQASQVQNNAFNYITSVGGSANAVTGTLPLGISTFTTGAEYSWIPLSSNTGNATMTVNTSAVATIQLNGAACVGYEMRKGCPIRALFDGTFLNIIAGAHGGDGNPIGSSVHLSHSSFTPNGYLLAFGQSVSQTTYADYFALVGTTYGPATGGNFTMPDFRGRVPIGKDDMGGSAALRITAAVSGITGTTLGSSGGDQSQQSHTHVATDSGHGHANTDPGHAHREQVSTEATGNTGTPSFCDDPVNSVGNPAIGLSQNGSTSILNTVAAVSNITVNSGTANVTNSSTGSGNSQNVQPAIVQIWAVKV